MSVIQKGMFYMKKLIFSLLVCGSLMAYADDPAPAAPAPDAAKIEKRIASQAKQLKMSVEEFKKLTPEQVKAKKEELKAKNAAEKERNLVEQAEKLKIPLEEFKKLTPAERAEKIKAFNKAEREAKKAAAAKAKAEREAKKAAAKAAK